MDDDPRSARREPARTATSGQGAVVVPDVSPDLPTPGWRALLGVLGQLPQAGLSRAFGHLADLRLPRPMRKPILGSFARAVGIDVSEAELPLADYQSVNAFFVRRLRPGVRSFPEDPAVLACPVDGVVGQLGTIRGGEALQAKGRPYSVAKLLDDAELAARYDGGFFITLYLSPRHYHRIHSPCDGAVPMARHVPGSLLPVNQPAISHVQDLFPKNERLVCAIDGAVGRIAVVAIGAYNVGRISAAFDPGWPGAENGWVTNRGEREPRTRHYQPPRPVRQGEEIMAFHLGSTVVLLAEPGRVRVTPRVEPGCEVRLGEAIARSPESEAS